MAFPRGVPRLGSGPRAVLPRRVSSLPGGYEHVARFKREELLEAYQGYARTRERIDAGELWWDQLRDHFTEDAVFVDPAWGRVGGSGQPLALCWRRRLWTATRGGDLPPSIN